MIPVEMNCAHRGADRIVAVVFVVKLVVRHVQFGDFWQNGEERLERFEWEMGAVKNNGV